MTAATSARAAATRFRRDDWLELGLGELVAHGKTCLTLEHLCESAGRTRGSFYHHFADHETFVRALLERWVERQTDAVIALVEARGGARLSSLQELAGALDHALDIAIRRLAASEPLAATTVAEVDADRLAFLEKLYRQEHGLPRARAHRLAEMEYALFVGMQTLWPDRKPEDFVSYKTLMGALLSADGA